MAGGRATKTWKPRFIPTPLPNLPVWPNRSQGKIEPAQTFYSAEMKEFFLPYDDVRNAASPEETLMDFCQTTYEAGANLAGWDRAALERPSNSSV